MWRIMLTTLFYAVMVESRPMDRLDGAFWPQDASIPSLDLYAQRNPEVRRQRSFHISSPDTDYELLVPQVSQKRALTLFARWNSLSNIGKQRTPIRSNVNTSTYERQHGQPLRWG